MIIRDLVPGSSADLAAVIRIHRAAFPHFFLTEMGPGFLGAYYLTVRRYGPSVFLVAEDDAAVTGFVAGFGDSTGFYASMKRRWWRLFLPLMLGIVRRPQLIRAVLANLTRVLAGLGQPRGESMPGGRSDCELASIAVDPACGGSGVGARLVIAFCERARDLGARTVTLTTERDDNESVNRFYRKLGFSVVREFHRGAERAMLEYELRLDT
jgi:ribosomal protein S18 acetylase RimI-like enzyme